MANKSKGRGGNGPQRLSPSYRLPALDQDFLLSDGMRGVRFQLEYAKAEEALRAHGIRSTIVVFGSARVSERGNAQRRRWYAQAREFAHIASERGGALFPNNGVHDNVIATGGGPGIMEAANRGAADAGAHSIGFNIQLPHEQTPNKYSTPELTFQFHYFAMRKMHLAMRANALVIFPGGLGTLDEMFEVLTLHQTGKVARLPVVLFDKAYWMKVISFEALLDADMIERQDLKLFEYADTAEEIWAKLMAAGMPIAAKGTTMK